MLRLLMPSLLLLALATAPAGAQAVELTEQGTLLAELPQPSAALGRSVAAQGALAVAGAPGVPPDAPAAGRALVFSVQGGSWSQATELFPPGEAGPRFGAAVALWGNTLLVGAPDANGTGVVYVFSQSGAEAASWSLQATLEPADGEPLDDFGAAVALHGDTALVGAPLDDDGGSRTGSAYVFTRQGSSWSQQAKLGASARQPDDRFGSAVALLGDRALVGAPHTTFPSDFTGFAAIFERDGGAWSQMAQITPSTGLPGDGFGHSVALADEHALVGAPFHDARGSQAGAAYVYALDDGAWQESAVLLDVDGRPGDQAGSAVALADGVAYVGAPLDDGVADDAGTVLVWQAVGDAWEPRAAATPSGAGTGHFAGRALAATSQRLLVGAPGADEPTDSGALTAFLADVVQQQTFFDLGQGLPGFFGQALLDGTGTLEGGTPVTLSLSNAQPVSVAFVFLGFSAIDAPFRGGTLVPAPDKLMPPIFLGLQGGFFLESTWPPGVPSGFEVYLQAWWEDPGGPVNAAASNALLAVTP